MCIIKRKFQKGAQKDEPFVLIKPDATGWVYGTADNVRSGNDLIIAKHLDCEKALEYIEKYETSNREPHLKFESILHTNYQDGNMSIKSLEPIITEKHWNDRNSDEINDLRIRLQKHLLDRKDKQLSQFASKNAREIISVCLFIFFHF